MTATEKPIQNKTTNNKILISGAFESPSIIKFFKEADQTSNAFDSPAIVFNGAKENAGIDPKKSPSVILLSKGVDEGANDALTSPAVISLGASDESIKNAMTSPSLQYTSESKTKNDMPLSLIIGQDTIKTALILLAVNPSIGGIVIAGGKGTGKSAMARAIHRVMPPIEVVKGSEYNISPEAMDNEIDDFLRDELNSQDDQLSLSEKLKKLETEIVTCPFVQVPVNVMEDRLFGSVDVKKTLETGKTIFTPGLLASAHRGILYIDDINLLDMDLLTILLGSLTDGYVQVEREGISVRYPCKPILIATMNPEDSELKDVFLDRIGIALNSDTEPLDLPDRVKAVNQVLPFAEGTMDKLTLDDIYAKEDQLKSAIIFAREYLKNTKVSTDQIRYLCEESIRGGCEGHRAEITAARIALASAALEDSPVRADDLRLAVKLAIVPRSLFKPKDDVDEEMLPPPPPPPPPAPSQSPENNMDENKDKEDEEDDSEDEDTEDEDDDDEEDDEEEQGQPSIPEEFMFEAVPVNMQDDMMKFGGRQKTGKGGNSGIIFSRDRGRYVRPVVPRAGDPVRVAIDATLREAAKNQVYRRAEAVKRGGDPTKIYVEGGDVRAKLMARKAGSLIIFAVDASGSMALNRMNAAKGAACGLLTEAYQSRDKIALIPFQGQTAEVLLPPTRSISLAKNRLDTMPCGGGSPLAHALTQSVRTGINAMESGDVGRCIIVLISDGRANVPLNVSLAIPSETPETTTTAVKLTDAEKKQNREALKEEVLTVAKQIGSMSAFKLLVVDTENKFVSTGFGKEIAQAAGGKYHYIPKASADAMKRVTVDAVASLKSQK
eukprot:CAMPEP_0196761972 /NCGR_PEP_ID=MMETSP1095-20130614/1296_1 /TAXON_ID=96789 ORGANISM="Chromulina nebulosa, Strain UTEXLB2642" /NCGR_SAMPLE_ID=MMETSP1095 /ASSEMBLY_ACC=CAM_ASM_000446 /LENGTH=834 /DNA_ID=CAMNT_0042112145 /DNA_START=82 /DNA_END=2586 /DNA_ORIENTATION=+